MMSDLKTSRESVEILFFIINLLATVELKGLEAFLKATKLAHFLQLMRVKLNHNLELMNNCE